MKTCPSLATLAFLALALPLPAAVAANDALSNWPQWRGPLANGVAPQADPPLEWSETTNVKWKAPLSGEGSASPVVWGNRVFVLTAVPTGKPAEPKPEAKPSESPAPAAGNPPSAGTPAGDQIRRGGPGGGFGSSAPTVAYQFVVLCVDRDTGKPLWQRVAREETPHEGHQANNTFASASPITDGQIMLAFFGSRGLHCYDLDGKPKWSRDFGRMRTKMTFGEGATPALHGDTVIVNWDDEADNDFIVALDKNTGKELWRTPRNEGTGWSTPLIVEHEKKLQVIVNATGKVRSYDFATGQELWACAGQTANAIPSPVADADTVYVTSGFRGSALLALALGRTGDLAGTDAIRWNYPGKNTPYVPSPLLVDGRLYTITFNNGVLSCFDAKTGKPHFEGQKLEGVSSVYTSPVSAKDRVYVLSREGQCLVLKKSPALEVLATNLLDDKTDASIALAGKDLFIRGRKSLYCIAEK